MQRTPQWEWIVFPCEVLYELLVGSHWQNELVPACYYATTLFSFLSFHLALRFVYFRRLGREVHPSCCHVQDTKGKLHSCFPDVACDYQDGE